MEELKNDNEKKTWQATKEGWYDHIPLTVRQLDYIIWGGIGLLVVIFILIILEATDVLHVFDLIN